MKLFPALKMTAVFCVLAAGLILCPPCKAQSEIVPDHFDGTDSWATRTRKVVSAKPKQTPLALQSKPSTPVRRARLRHVTMRQASPAKHGRAVRSRPTSSAAQTISACSTSPLLCPGLVVQNLSIYATMPDANGRRQVTTSFRIVNQNPFLALPSNTTVQSAGVTTVLPTPSLGPGATAFFGTTVTTSSTDFMITVTPGNKTIVATPTAFAAGNNGSASYHFLAAAPTFGRWRPIGPSMIVNSAGIPQDVGRVTTIAVDPTSTGILYAGARASGLWKTTDGGAHWEPLTDALSTLQIDAVAVDAANPTHVFLATPAGIFASLDGGHVWTMRNKNNLGGRGNDGGAFIARGFSRPVVSALAAAPRPSGTGTAPQASFLPFFPLPTIFNVVFLYLTTTSGLQVSLDGGFTWSTSLPGGFVGSLDQDRSNVSHLLATVAGTSAAGVYETFTGGLTPASWHKLQGCAGATLPTFSQNAGLWVAQSGTMQWISVKTGAQHDLWTTTSQTCSVNGSPEHGWTLLSSGDSIQCIGPDSEWSYLHADPSNAQVLYKAGVRLCRSTDGGATFQSVPGLHDDHHALVFHPLAPNLLFEGNDGGLFQSGDGGQSWAFDAQGLSVTEFLDADYGGAAPRIMVGSSQDNGLSSTDLTSPVWQAVDLGPDPDGDRTTAVVDPLNPNVQYSIGQAVDHLDITQNGASTFDNAGLPSGCITYQEFPPFLFTQFVATNSPNVHLLTTVGRPNNQGGNCNGDGGLWGVLSSGLPWQPLFAPIERETFVRVAYDPSNGVILAGGDRGSIYTLLGKVWPQGCSSAGQPPCASVTAIVPDATRPSNYFVSLAVGSGPWRIFEIGPSAPLQYSGQDITANLPAALILTLASNPFEAGVLYAGTQGQGVFRGVRDATGQWSWQAFNNGIPGAANVTKLRVDPASGTIYAATYGRGEFALDTLTIF